ncbi:MAG: NAD(P)H-hydrate dehydratase [Nitrospirota bacterium]
MKVATAEEMRNIDRTTIEGYGIQGVVLMERAGLAVASKIKELFSRRKVIVISGGGNNGGDGFVVARNLYNEGWEVKVFLTSKLEDLKGDALLQYKTAVKFGVVVQPVEELLNNHASIITHHCIVVDAILGTGLSKNVSGMLSEVINILNRSNKPVVSVDIPSGISSDNGQILGDAAKADYTVTFGIPKRGHLLYPGAEYSGKLFIEDIGFPNELLTSAKLNIELLERDYVSNLMPERQAYSHKGDYGHVLIVAGSKGKTGAALMTAKACLKVGAGLVTLGIPESLANIFQSRVTEEMILILPDKGDGTLSGKASDLILEFLHEKADILAIGPGIGISAETNKLMKALIENSTSPMVIDADGINSIRGETEIFLKAKTHVILTPHTGEMAGLLQHSAPLPLHLPEVGKVRKGLKAPNAELRTKIEQDRINIAMSFARETKTHLVLKGVPTIIAAPDGRVFINPTGNPGMATAGTGDVLTGIISGFLSQNMSPLDASILGIYMHGLAGDIAASEKGQYSLIATDIIDKIPFAFCSLKTHG